MYIFLCFTVAEMKVSSMAILYVNGMFCVSYTCMICVQTRMTYMYSVYIFKWGQMYSTQVHKPLQLNVCILSTNTSHGMSVLQSEVPPYSGRGLDSLLLSMGQLNTSHSTIHLLTGLYTLLLKWSHYHLINIIKCRIVDMLA